MNRRAVIAVSILMVVSFLAPACSFGPTTPVPTAPPIPTKTPMLIFGIDIPISMPGSPVTLIFDSIELKDGKTSIGNHFLLPSRGKSVVAVLKGHYTGDLDDLIRNGWQVDDGIFYIVDPTDESNIFSWKAVDIDSDTHSFTFGFFVPHEGPYVLHHGIGDNYWEIDLSPLISMSGEIDL